MGLLELLEYLVVKQLANNPAVDMVYKHFIEFQSVSDIGRMYGVSKHSVRGYVTRVLEKSGGSRTKAMTLLKYVYPLVKEIRPVIIRDGDGLCICLLCGEKMMCNVNVAEFHVTRKHMDIVRMYVDDVLGKLRSRVKAH